MYISDKFLKFSVNKLFKFRHISKIKYVYCVVHVAIQTLFWFVSFIDTYAYARTHKHTHTHAHKHSHRLKFFNFLERLRKQMSNWYNTGPRNLIQAKFKIFNENIRSNKDSGQIERNKLTYLHYLNKMIEKYKMRKFIFSEVSCF